MIHRISRNRKKLRCCLSGQSSVLKMKSRVDSDHALCHEFTLLINPLLLKYREEDDLAFLLALGVESTEELDKLLGTKRRILKRIALAISTTTTQPQTSWACPLRNSSPSRKKWRWGRWWEASCRRRVRGRTRSCLCGWRRAADRENWWSWSDGSSQATRQANPQREWRRERRGTAERRRQVVYRRIRVFWVVLQVFVNSPVLLDVLFAVERTFMILRAMLWHN